MKIKIVLVILAGLLISCTWLLNTEPLITSLTADNTINVADEAACEAAGGSWDDASCMETVFPGDTVSLTCTAEDVDGDILTYSWECTDGSLAPDGSTATWTAPDSSGTYSISCAVTDGNDGHSIDIIDIAVQ